LEYLETWKTSRGEWRFKKVRQTFLLQHAYNPVLLPKDSFETFIDYLAGLEGLAKDTTLKKAKEVLEAKLPEVETVEFPDGITDEERLEREKQKGRQEKTRENAEKLHRIQQVRARKIIKGLEKE